MKHLQKLAILSSLLLVSCISNIKTANAQSPPQVRERYLTPPDDIAEEVLAPRYKNVTLRNLDPDREFFLNDIEEGMEPIARYAQTYYNLGGLQINPASNRNRRFTTQSTIGLQLIGARNGETEDIETPEDAIISTATWSPDGSKLAYFAHFDDATHIYVANLENGKSKKITKTPVLATLNTSFKWSADGNYIYTVLVPDNRGDEPQKPQAPTSPFVKQTTQEENRLRTYQDLLEGAFEAKLLEYYITGQFARINADNGKVRTIGEPAMIRDIEVSPGGKYAIVESLQKPFSYIVPVYSFPWVEEIWDLDGNVLTQLRKSDLRQGVPDAEETEDYGRDDIKWRPDGNGLSLIIDPNYEVKDDKEKKEEEEKDKEDKKEKVRQVIQWLPPFGNDDQNVVYETKKEMNSVSYAENTDMLFIRVQAAKKDSVYAVLTNQPKTTFTIYKHKDDDFYDDPGSLMYSTAATGLPVVRMTPDKKNVFLSGRQYYKKYEEEAPRPFIDRINIRSGEKERIFQSSEDAYEQVTAVLDDKIEEVVVERQSSNMLPDSWLLNLKTDEKTKLTSNIDYNKAITHAQRKRVKIKRADGFEFWVEVVLPADWDGEALPGIIWHYPSEYDDQKDYDESQRRFNKNDFPGVYARSADIFVKHGYAVIDADWPIAAERGAPNDGFVWSIVQNSSAVIDSLAARGYIDRNRMAIGGHSYGAFGTANAMIHTSFFKAGIAGDGNYNRTLTPIGFQREPRDLWRGQERYLQMSPIFWADQLDGALLMYHGGADQNVGTWPTNSRRMFHALNALGKTAALYIYPHEAHGPGAKETLLDMWTRWINWLDHYVKNKGDYVIESDLGK